MYRHPVIRFFGVLFFFFACSIGSGFFVSFVAAQTTTQTTTTTINTDSSWDTAICGSSPQAIALIDSFVRDVISAIPTQGTKYPYLGKPVPPSWFDKGTFSPPKQTVLSQATRRAQESLGSFLAVQRIFFPMKLPPSVGILSSNAASKLAGTAILTKNKVFYRDWQKLVLLEQLLQEKKYELSVGNGWLDTIAGTNLTTISTIFSDYQEQGLFWINTHIDDNANYKDLVSMLGYIINLSKNALAYWSYDALKGSISDTNIQISFDPGNINAMEWAYRSTQGQGNVCKNSSSWSEFKKSIKTLGKTMKAGGGTAWDSITESTCKLKSAFGIPSKKNCKDKDDYYTQDDKATLLRTIYGVKTYKMISGSLLSVSSPNFRSERIATIKNSNLVKQGNGGNWDNDDGQGNWYAPKNSAGNAVFLSLDQSLKNTFNQASLDKMTSDIADNDDVLSIFSSISSLVNEARATLGSRNDSNSLISNAGDLCQKQCANIGSKMCFY